MTSVTEDLSVVERHQKSLGVLEIVASPDPEDDGNAKASIRNGKTFSSFWFDFFEIESFEENYFCLLL